MIRCSIFSWNTYKSVDHAALKVFQQNAEYMICWIEGFDFPIKIMCPEFEPEQKK